MSWAKEWWETRCVASTPPIKAQRRFLSSFTRPSILPSTIRTFLIWRTSGMRSSSRDDDDLDEEDFFELEAVLDFEEEDDRADPECDFEDEWPPEYERSCRWEEPQEQGECPQLPQRE